jgi:prepilin-type N-terminal cleavage/methylation domain-containing protein
MNRLLREQRGFTAAELLVAMALSAVAAVVIYSVFFSTRGSYFDTRDVADTQSNSRNVISLLSQDLRSAGSNPRLTGAVQRLPVANGVAVRIQNDADGSGVINAIGEPAEDVTWSYDEDAETVVRTTPEGATTLLTDVTNLQFAYLDAAGNALGPLPLTPENRDLVRAVNVLLTVRILDDATRTWNTVLALRNDP